jgi:hypothetical protein
MFLRIYTGEDGESHFEDLELPPPGDPEFASKATSRVSFHRVPVGFFHDWHTAPTRLYCFILSGILEYRVRDGSIRRHSPGDVMIAEDLTGRGHVMRVASDEPTLLALVPFEDA